MHMHANTHTHTQTHTHTYPSYEGDANSGVGSDEFDQNLCADVPKQLLNVLSDEWVLHDRLPVCAGICSKSDIIMCTHTQIRGGWPRLTQQSHAYIKIGLCAVF